MLSYAYFSALLTSDFKKFTSSAQLNLAVIKWVSSLWSDYFNYS